MAKSKTLELSIKIAGQMDKSLTAAITNSNTLLGSLSTTMSKVGTAGLAAMGALATGTVAAIASCTQEAAKFENYMSDVVKVVDGLADAAGKVSGEIWSVSEGGNGKTYAENYGAMADVLLDLSTQIPMTVADLTDLAEAAGQSGKTFEDLTQTSFLKDIAMWGTAMDVSADQAGDWGAKWEQAFNMNHDQVMEVADVINYLGNNYATTAAEIAESVNASASMGQLAGVDVKATAAIAASMQAMGVSSDSVGTSVKRIYTNISKGSSATKAQQEMWKELGFTAEGIAKSMQVDGTGTLMSVFEAINDLPNERKIAALNTLFGQWAIEGGAKITQNLDLLEEMLEKVSNENVWDGSMEKEFIIKASTSEALDTMMENAKYALQVDVGEAFLPAKKEFSLAMVKFLNSIREDMPQLQQLAESLGSLASKGVEKLGEAMDWALPYIQKGLDYLVNNGGKVADTLGKMAAAFVGMKFAPQITSLLSGAGGLIFGSGSSGKSGGLLSTVKNLFKGGQNAASNAGTIIDVAKANTSMLADGNTNSVGAAVTGLFAALKNKGGITSSSATKRSQAFENMNGIIQSVFENGVLGSAKNAFSNTGIGKYLSGIGTAISGNQSAIATLKGGLGGSIGSVLSAGGGVLSSVWSPVFSGFGSLVSGAVPVVAAISGIIAVVSILGDNLDSIREIVGNVFGEKGLAVFDTFTGKLSQIGTFITGLFADGGVAEALEPLRETVVNLFGEKGGAAFDGLTTILQSVMGVIGQIVNFATGTVKPIIQEIFGFITGTVVPGILNIFTAASPYIAGIISGLGSAIMAGMELLGGAIQAAMPLVEGIINLIMNIGTVAIPAVLGAVSAFPQSIAGVIGGVKTIFGGLITFLDGVFSFDMEKVLNGLSDMALGVFESFGALFKIPINAVIGLINGAISGINNLGLTIPEWVPVLGGKTFAINIPPIDMLAKGGFTNGVSIAGEAGTEAVISFQRSVRKQNLSTWARAGELLGVKPVELADFPTQESGTAPSVTFAPQIVIQGNADRGVVDEALARAKEEFERWYIQMQRKYARTAY